MGMGMVMVSSYTCTDLELLANERGRRPLLLALASHRLDGERLLLVL